MKIIAVNFRRADTQIVLGKKVKNGIEVLRVEEDKAMTSFIGNKDVNALNRFFRQIKKIDNTVKDLYVAVPPNMTFLNFAKSEFVENINEFLVEWCRQILDVNDKDYYVDTPLVIREKSGGYNITAGAMKREFVDTLFQSSINADFPITSIEPSALCAVRYLVGNAWNKVKPFFVLESEKKILTLTAFSPAKGLFNMQFPDIGWELFQGEEQEVIKEEFGKYIQIFDKATLETFLEEILFDFYIFPEQNAKVSKIFQDINLENRIKRVPKNNPYLFSKFVVDEVNFATVMGILLRNVYLA